MFYVNLEPSGRSWNQTELENSGTMKCLMRGTFSLFTWCGAPTCVWTERRSTALWPGGFHRTRAPPKTRRLPVTEPSWGLAPTGCKKSFEWCKTQKEHIPPPKKRKEDSYRTTCCWSLTHGHMLELSWVQGASTTAWGSTLLSCGPWRTKELEQTIRAATISGKMIAHHYDNNYYNNNSYYIENNNPYSHILCIIGRKCCFQPLIHGDCSLFSV